MNTWNNGYKFTTTVFGWERKIKKIYIKKNLFFISNPNIKFQDISMVMKQDKTEYLGEKNEGKKLWKENDEHTQTLLGGIYFFLTD